MRPNTEAGKEQSSLVHICLLLFSTTVFVSLSQCEREEAGIEEPVVWSVQTMLVFYEGYFV